MSKDEFGRFIEILWKATEGVRFPRRDEKAFQDTLEQCFSLAGLGFVREQPLAPGDRPDFFFVNGVVVETKVKSGIVGFLSQCRRYAMHDAVCGIVLIAVHPHDMPDTLCEKPCACMNFAGKCL